MPLTKAPKRRLKKGSNTKTSGKTEFVQAVKVEVQQRILDIFGEACSDSITDSLPGTVQEIKQFLFDRDFVKAFGNLAYLEAYTARWSPTRALTYLDILCSLPAISDQFSMASLARLRSLGITKAVEKLSIGNEAFAISDAAAQRQRVVCFGAGGGAELIALSGALHQIQVEAAVDQIGSDLQKRSIISLDCVLVDCADWSPVLQKLHSVAITSTPIPRESSKQKGNITAPLINDSDLAMSVMQKNILSASSDELDILLGGATLVTIMFTLNELYNTSIGSTTKMLLSLTSFLEPGSLLLVVDSPSSYSTVDLGKSVNITKDLVSDDEKDQTAKQYPMQWLLDHTLLETATVIDLQEQTHKQWEKLEAQPSKWFRLSPQLQYPIELEDMRYQMHLYKRL